jgi:hypothetical protein
MQLLAETELFCKNSTRATFVLSKRRDENNHNSTATDYFALQMEIWYEIKS